VRWLAAALVATACGSSSPPAREPVGSLAPRADDEMDPDARHTACGDAIAQVERLAGDLAVDGFAGLTSRVQWQEACPRFSPWVRRCLVLSTTRDELSSCAPENEPWSRRHEFGQVPPDEKAQFLDCVDRAANRPELARCGYL